MHVPIVVVVTIGVAGTIVLAVLVGATILQLRTLSRAVHGFGAAIAPRVEEFRRGSDEAQRKMQSLATRGPGARLGP